MSKKPSSPQQHKPRLQPRTGEHVRNVFASSVDEVREVDIHLGRGWQQCGGGRRIIRKSIERE
jgi:hypothetical protein